jgi:diguanylate cyclase (GGDEF)-like protein
LSNLDVSISDTSLRRRLLVGSISLAIAVSIIFIVVAYRLASDLAESTEVKEFNKQFQWVFGELEGLYSEIEDPDKLLTAVLNAPFYQSLESDLVAVEILVNNKLQYQIRNMVDTTQIIEELGMLNFPINANGAMDANDQHLVWQFQRSSDNAFSLLVVRKISGLEEALDYIANRLSITAFLTFWLAIWAALVMSALITKRFEENNEKLAYLAMHDSLTGLKNRTYLVEFFNSQHAERKNTELSTDVNSAALLMIDLNKFKDVNDTFGHTTGDQLIQVIALRLKKAITKKDVLVRYGGDEFVILLNLDDSRDVIPLVSAILICCGQPVPLANTQFEVGASIGVAYYPQDGEILDTLFKHADIAMYQAKKLRTGFEFYQKQLPDFSERQVLLRGQLSQALESQQFILVYQPKVSLPDGKLIGLEALARWQHPVEGLLSPAEFIDLIEQSGTIHSFSRFVITEAIRQASEWMAAGKSIPISINLSAYNLTDVELVPFFKQQLDHYQVPAHLLEVELTESASMADIKITQNAFAQLHSLGIKLSIDDFGTGMSSFAYLRELDMDFVKIDRSFVATMLDDRRNELLIKGLISMCHSLEKNVIAEGIETEAQAQKLFELGCRIGQGYFFGKPSFVSDITPRIS